MPYQSLLDNLLRSVDGAQAALLMDSEGELVMQAGTRDFRYRLIGAYQGIGLATARRTGQKHAVGAIHYILCHYSQGEILLRPLKDGYYLVVCLANGANLAQGVHRSAEIQDRMNAEL